MYSWNINANISEIFTCPFAATWQLCDPQNSNWTFCEYGNSASPQCLPGKQIGDRCEISQQKYPCRNPWLTCTASKCTPFFSVPFGGKCDGPSQCQIPLICNHTFFNYQTPTPNSVGYCVAPFEDSKSCSTDYSCRWPMQKCGCDSTSPACLPVEIDASCQAKWKAVEACGQAKNCYPPMYSSYGWVEWSGEETCIHEFCKEELLDFYCCYSCKTGTVFPGLTCDSSPVVYKTPNCCGGDQICYDAFYSSIKEQKSFCAWKQQTNLTIDVPQPPVSPPDQSPPFVTVPPATPISAPTNDVTAPTSPSNDYSYIVTTVAVALALAIGAAFFAVYYWKKKRDYEQITNWHEPNSVNMQQLGVSVGN